MIPDLGQPCPGTRCAQLGGGVGGHDLLPPQMAVERTQTRDLPLQRRRRMNSHASAALLGDQWRIAHELHRVTQSLLDAQHDLLAVQIAAVPSLELRARKNGGR